jgi:hypothetical protein
MAEHTVYLTTGKIQDGKNAGRLLAVLSLGSPQRGDESATGPNPGSGRYPSRGGSVVRADENRAAMGTTPII